MTPHPGSLHTAHMLSLLDRWRQGEQAAGNELFHYIQQRLQDFAHRMLRRFPGVQAQAETADVVQQSCVRLIQALRQVTSTSMAHFRNVAYQQVRWELLSLAQHFQGKSPQPLPEDFEPAAPGTTPAEVKDLEKWADYFEAVNRLPEEDRELFNLRVFERLTWAEVARELGIHERTARERWAGILITLRKALGGWAPPPDDLPA